MNKKHTQAGFGLIEILITLVVLGVGLIAIANLQGKLFQNSADARDKVAAVNLAQKKLEDLRNFSQLQAGADFGYAEIDDNSGGMKDAEGLLLPSGNYQIGNTTFNLSWTVAGQSYGSDNQPAVVDNTATPNIKRVTVRVTWNGLDGPGEAEIIGNISSLTPSSAALTMSEIPDRQGPIVPYVPGAAPDYVPIDISDTSKKESSTPDPTVSQKGEYTLTTFDEVTYDTKKHTQRRDEYVTANCVCKQAGTGDGYEPTLEVYDSDSETVITLVGEEVSKRVGVPADNQQFDLCTACCRDHHDSASSTYKYDPFRPGAAAAGGGDHDHYYPDKDGVLQLANGAGDLYLEACRFKRVDGHLRVMPDWHLASLQVMPAMFVGTNTGDYASYVQQFVEDYVKGINHGSNYPVDYAAPETVFPNEPVEQAMGVGQTDQFIARGVYLDYMDASLVAEIKKRIGAGEYYLDIVPFHEVNLTKFATWSVVTDPETNTASDLATVTNEALKDGGANNRGFLTAQKVGTAYVQAVIENDNTGLTDTAEIDPHYPVTTEEFYRSDAIKLVIGADKPPADTPMVGGSITIKPPVKINHSAVTVAGSGGASCSKITDSTYNCALDASGNGTITFGNYNDLDNKSNVNNNVLAPASFAGAVVTVQNDGTMAETTSYAFSGAVGEQTLDVSVNAK